MNPHDDATEPAEPAETPAIHFGPQANALKHGYCATKIVDPELRARAEEILEQLRQIHDPWSLEENEAIDELAQTLARLERLETAMDARIADEKARSAELYDQKAQAAFEADLARFRENPAFHAQNLGRSYLGANWLEQLWTRVENELKPDANPSDAEIATPFLTFQVAADAAAALGGFWQVDQADDASAWLMARQVRVAPETDEALTVWIDRSRSADGPKTTLARARRLLARVPADPARAVAELAEKAAAEKCRWAMQANTLRPVYETARVRAAESAVGTGSGDPALEKEFRLLARYLTSARNRSDRLRRRIDILKKDRKTFAWRAQQKAERDAQRLKKESEKALRRYEDEIAGQHREAKKRSQAEPRNPANANRSTESRMPNYAESFVEPPAANPAVASVAAAPGRSTEVTEYQHDKSTLPNGSGLAARADFADLAPADGDETDEPLDAEEAAKEAEGRAKLAAWASGGGSLKERLRLIRYRNWSSPSEVMEDEEEILRKLYVLPDSFERSFTVQALFGSMKAFRRCCRAYVRWADPKVIDEARAKYGAGVS